MRFESLLLRITTWLLVATALTPLVASDWLYFAPFVFGKAVFYRTLVELALIAFSLALVLSLQRRTVFPVNLQGMKHPLTIVTGLFFLSAILSAFTAENPYRAFFGDVQRGEGLFGLLHYGAFFFLALGLFRKKEWLIFFSTLLGTGFLSVLYAWFQYFDWGWVPFALTPASQPGSFSGNPSYLASFLILLFGVGAVVYPQVPEAKKVFRYGILALVPLMGLTIFLTAVRGAILGLVVGLLCLGIYLVAAGARAMSPSLVRNTRALGVTLVALLVLGSSFFWATRNSSLWLSVPGLGRLTKISFENTSVVSRLIALKVSWAAFEERPLAGWGPENYNIAYNKYYDPSYAFYAEDWFDRAHNRFADILVMQGTLGIIIYLGLLGTLLYVIYTRGLRGGGSQGDVQGRTGEVPLLMSVFVAYIVQNLFLFDQFTSYIPFFALVAYIIYAQSEARGSRGDVSREGGLRRGMTLAGAFFLIGMLGWSLYAWNYMPVRQALEFKRIMGLKVGEKILAQSDSFLAPYNFAQAEIRAKFVEIMYNSGLLKKKGFSGLVDKALFSFEEVVRREPYEPRNYSRLIESYNERAKEDPAIFTITEGFARKAVALSPKRQGLLSHLSFILSGQGRYEESIDVARGMVALDDRVAKSHYHLAISLALAADAEENKGKPMQKQYREEAERELDRAMDLGSRRLGSLESYTDPDLSGSQYYLFLESDLKNMLVLYRTFEKPEKMARVIEVLAWFHPKNKDYRHDAIVIYRALRNKERLIAHATELARLDPELKEDLETIIDLARKENWTILDTL